MHACKRWGLLYYYADKGWISLSTFGEAYLTQRGE